MFKVADRSELSQISLTGVRGIVLLGLLIVKPRTIDEIRDAFVSYNILDSSSSKDVIRVDINTLKHMGCEISRASQKTDYKYVLGNHPFALKITEKEISVLNRVYRAFVANSNVYDIVKFDELFNKIAKYIGDADLKEKLLGISILKRIDNRLVLDLLSDCNQQRTIELVYVNSVSSVESRKVILAQKIALENDKLYLLGYDIEKKRSVMLPLEKIKKIILRKLKKDYILTKSTKVRFKLIDVDKQDLNEEEKILEVIDNGFIVEGSYHNDFMAVQRILYLGAKCTVIEPNDFKQVIIRKLKEMRDVYGK